MLVGYAPRSYSDLAEYKRLPMSRRIERLQKAGENLYLRRKYEEAITVFESILALDKSDLEAKLWITKAREKINRERQEQKKKELYQKYGHLIPKELTYYNWHWGPSVGHFEVRYSKPKPYVPPVRKVHPKATDAEIAEQEKKAKDSGSAEDLFELAMRYWSRKEKDKAMKAYFKAVKINPEILANDDELLLATVGSDVRKKIESGEATPEDYLNSGRIGMLQGDHRNAVKNLIEASVLKPALKQEAAEIIESFIQSPNIESMSIPAEIFSYRQAYVFDKNEDLIYLRIVGVPRNGNLIFPLDVTFDLEAVNKIELKSDDVVMVFGLPGFDGATRLWFVLPEKERYSEYEIRVVLHVDRSKSKWLDLSNFSIPPELPDNWSFVIGSEFNFGESVPKGEYQKNKDGVQITGYHLSRSDGKGPYLALENFKEPMPKQLDIWQLMLAAEDLEL
ncbi:MAG: hypothetical protein Kow0029_09960 [Candidatus Rifleibacteriota bacterium]